MTDTGQCKVECDDGTIEVLAANAIAENMFMQVDEEDKRQMMLDEIIDHRVLDGATPKGQGAHETKNGLTRNKPTTRGWEVCVQWKTGDTDWVSLKDLKDSHPIKLAECAVMNELQEEPAFAWWVKCTLKKRESIMKKVKSKC